MRGKFRKQPKISTMRVHNFLLFPTAAVLAGMLLLGGCREKRPDVQSRLGRAAPEMQRFQIPSGRDTVLRCASGALILIMARTFDTEAPTVTLEVQECLRREEMVAAGLGTGSSDGRALESAGMLYLGAVAPAGLTIHRNFPIEVRLPARGLRSELQVFTGIEDSSGTVVDWQSPRPLENDELVAQIAEGKSLFCQNCTPCHSPRLHEDMIGPALGNVHLFRSAEWLRQYTRQATTLLAEGDSLARCVDARWPTARMNDLPHLTDDEVRSIYRFIAEESVVQYIDASPEGFPCAGALSGPYAGVPPTFAREEERFYIFPVQQFGWLNCDVFTDRAPEVPLAVTVADWGWLDTLSVVLVYERRNIVLPLTAFGPVFSLRADGRATLPLEPVRIIGWGYRGRQFFKGVARVTIGESNLIRLKLQPAVESGPEEALARDLRLPAPAGSGCDWGWTDLMEDQ
jgi:mono/diheme cytochrome c family protein